jgi:hypothetical protein
MSLAKPAGRNSDLDADREAALGYHYHVTQIT